MHDVYTDKTTDLRLALEAQKRRIIGLVLAEYGEARKAGAMEIADALDRLATKIEQES
jgi:hypothetical protein